MLDISATLPGVQSVDELAESHHLSTYDNEGVLHENCLSVTVGELHDVNGGILKPSEANKWVQDRSGAADLNFQAGDSPEGDPIASCASYDSRLEEDSEHNREDRMVGDDSACIGQDPSSQDDSLHNVKDLRYQDNSACNGKDPNVQNGSPHNGKYPTVKEDSSRNNEILQVSENEEEQNGKDPRVQELLTEEDLQVSKKEEGVLEQDGNSQHKLPSRATASQSKQPVKKAAQRQRTSIPETKQSSSRKANRPSNVSMQKSRPFPMTEKNNITSPPDDVKLNGSMMNSKPNARLLSSQSLHVSSPRVLPCSPSGLGPGSPYMSTRYSSGSLPHSPVVTSTRPLRITVPPAERISKPASSRCSPRPMESSLSIPRSITSSHDLENKLAVENKFAETKTNQGSPDKERACRKVKELLHKRKTHVPFGAGKSLLLNNESDKVMDNDDLASKKNPDMGPFLLNLAKSAIASGDHPHKALELAARAAKSFERSSDGKPSLEHVTSLHILAAIYCSLGQFEEAIPVLQQAIALSTSDSVGIENALVEFAGYMQLGDTFSLLGRSEKALDAYHAGFDVQKQALGDMDPLVGETCRYLAEAHVQAMQFGRAEDLCNLALRIHKEHSPPASIEEATDRRLMGLILNGKGEYEAALEHLVLASMALIANEQELDVAAVDVSIGDTYVSLGRFDEAVFSYQKALTVFKSAKGENHASVASVYVSLAELYLKTGKLRESKSYCESALRIYSKEGAGHQPDEIASGSIEIAAVYEALNEQEQALSLLHKALDILESVPGQQSTVAGIEAQVGVLYYNMVNFKEACIAFQKAVSKFKSCGETKSSLVGVLLNQLGLSFVQLSKIEEAAEAFEEARSILESSCAPYHPDTLAAYSNLAGAYDALGRLKEAIQALEYVVEAREEKLGTAHPDVNDERRRLAELLKEAGRSRTRRLNGSLELLMHSNIKQGTETGQNLSANGSSIKSVDMQKNIVVEAH